MTQISKRILSFMLVLCMVFTMVPSTAFATGTTLPVGTSSVTDGGEPAVCEHKHDATCGYAEAVEGTPCSHRNEDGSYSCEIIGDDSEDVATSGNADKAYTCDHSDDCGFAEAIEGADCTHVCEQEDLQEHCSCKSICTDTLINSDCPLCSLEDADLTACKGEKAEQAEKNDCTCEPIIEGEGKHTSTDCPLYMAVAECDCEIKCTLADEENAVAENINLDCPVCGVENAEFSLCIGAVALTMPRTGVTPEVDTTKKHIYANGVTIKIVAGTEEASGSIYKSNILYDKNGDGTIEDNEYLKIGSTDPTEAGYTINNYTIYGGSNGTGVSSTGITMTGGHAASIYGGGLGSGGTVDGDTHVKISGGFIVTYANIVGGGSGSGATVGGDTHVEISGGKINDQSNVFGGGYGSGATVDGDTHVTITGSADLKSGSPRPIYGGGGNGAEVTGSTNVTISGNATINGYVYGGGSGGKVTNGTSVTVNGGNIDGYVYGGGASGDVGGDTTVTVSGGEVKNQVYGGGKSGNVDGNTNVMVSGGEIIYQVYGGGESGNVGGNTNVTFSGGRIKNNVYGGGNGASQVTGSTSVTVSGGNFEGSVYGGGTGSLTNPADIAVTGSTAVTIKGGIVNGAVCGGGGSVSKVNGTTTVTIEDGTVNAKVFGGGYGGTGVAEVSGSTEVTINGGKIGNVFGGSFNSQVTGTTTVTIWGGEMVSVFGGGYYTTDTTGHATVTIHGGSISDENASNLSKFDTGISGDTITINGGTIDVTGLRDGSTKTDGISGDTININSGTVTAKGGTGKQPFSTKPDLGTGVSHDSATGEWNNTAGTPCTYSVPASTWDGQYVNLNTNAGIGIGINYGAAGHLAVTMPAAGTYTYGTTSSDGTVVAQTASSAAALPTAGWNWAVHNNAGAFTLTLNNATIAGTGDYETLITKGVKGGATHTLTIKLVGNNTLTSTQDDAMYGGCCTVIIENGDAVGTGTLTAKGTEIGINAADDGSITFRSGHITAEGNFYAVFATTITLEPGMAITEPVGAQLVHNAFGTFIGDADGNQATRAVIEKTGYPVVVENGTGDGYYQAGETVTITAEPASGYTFTSWSVKEGGVTLANANSSTTTFTMPANAVTVTANWSYNGGGGGGGSSSGGGNSSSDNNSNITVTPPPADKPNTPTEGNIKVDGKVDGNGNATVSITDKNVNDAYNKALAEAKKNGNESNGITLVLNVNTGNKTANSLTVNLPKTVQDTIISKKIVNTVVVVDNPDIKIGMDLATVKTINTQAKADVNITATKQDNSKLTGNAKTAIGSRPVFNLAVNYGSGKQVSNFGAGSVAVEIPYTLGAGEKAGNVYAVYVDAKGNVQWLTSSVYDSVNKVLRFSTNHFSTYGIGYKAANANFTDITNHWAKDSIEFVVARGLLGGTSNTTFSPDTAMTRGMFVTTLGRLANADVSGYKTSSFSDVKADAYYMGYVEWASKNNIVNGIGDGKFAPDNAITREQMAVIMASYAKAIGFNLPKVHAENTFADGANIGSWAKDSVKSMQMAGVISGKDGNRFDPQGTATRAEVSAVLKRFVELAISSDTAQGWMMNDSGKWMYYENGKALTGKQTIGSVSYTFNSYGETNDTPRDLSYGTHTVVKNESWWSIARKYKCSMFELARINNKTIFSMLYVGDVLKVPESK